MGVLKSGWVSSNAEVELVEICAPCFYSMQKVLHGSGPSDCNTAVGLYGRQMAWVRYHGNKSTTKTLL